MKPIDTKGLDEARDTLRKHLPLEVVRDQLAAVEEQLAQRDARIAELERARPVVVESGEARRLREAWVCASDMQRGRIADGWLGNERANERAIGLALRAFCESAPPASAPGDEAELRRQLSESLDREAGLRVGNEVLQAWMDERTRQVAQLQDDLVDARNARDKARDELAARTEQAVKHAAEGDRWAKELSTAQFMRSEWQKEANRLRSERDAAQSEIAALKSAPVRAERDVDAELRAAMAAHSTWAQPDQLIYEYVSPETKRLILAGRAWLAAPLAPKAEPAQDHVADASKKVAPRISPEEQAERAPPPPETSGRLLKATPIKTAQADGERVTVYAKLFANGESGAAIWSQRDVERNMLAPGESWLAIEARVVREGGGK